MSASRPLPRRIVVTAAAAVTTLLLAACGGEAGGTPSTPTSHAAFASAPASSGSHNQADVTFAQGMIPHHRQAIAMATMAEEHASSQAVRALALKVKAAQTPEITTMTTWLKSWGEQVPQGMGGMGHGNASAMPGMMSNHDMDQLKGASGSAFDTMFLTMMIKHHEGAVEMANTEKQQGAYGPAKQMAANIVTSQTAEIARMRTMLGTRSPAPTAS